MTVERKPSTADTIGRLLSSDESTWENEQLPGHPPTEPTDPIIAAIDARRDARGDRMRDLAEGAPIRGQSRRAEVPPERMTPNERLDKFIEIQEKFGAGSETRSADAESDHMPLNTRKVTDAVRNALIGDS